MPTNNIITMDGPAASGKGTLARRVAGEIGYAYIDTGAIYRITALSAMQEGVDIKDEDAVAAIAENLAQSIKPDIFDSPDIRTDEVGQGASIVAAHPLVREKLMDVQRFLAVNPPALANGKAAKGAIMDGRDCGTVVCPEASIKLFITANTEIRAERRLKELQSKGIQVTYNAVLQDMQERDARDAGRETAPMIPAEDAIIVDTSSMNAEDAFAHVLAIVKK